MVRIPKETHPVDVYVGNRLRALRKKHKLSQAALAGMVGLSHQQIQQYEIGANRVAASMLYEFSRIMNAPISYFYEGFSEELLTENQEKADTLSMRRTAPLNILLVEDDAADEVLLRTALESCSHASNVYAVHDGAEALDFLRSKQHAHIFPSPDIVIMDYNIPKINGFSLLKELKQDRQLQHIPVVMFTNSLDPQVMRDAYQAHVSGFFLKSFDIEEFNRYIEVLVDYWHTTILPTTP
ncbi:MAG: response regulator [Hyphomicrobiales bacterium]|nr:response regulator [Hyphomicrobiales bacterium]